VDSGLASGEIREIEADLLDRGIKLFPATRTGERARLLWRRIKPRLLVASLLRSLLAIEA
jgi:hypothetical protein